ncbi:unnamed protein product [Rangifer tarandus platyrhynchus]|uniref:Secreted protein n=2 Tax=Rangifer tarandus platyrhynchus TaxID=3082113 RepID=A0ABN8YKN8_RANTA|nr:unnamed protein product [Rangifer tarandus platyrhynchus]CAI9697002.1 unnamed protein product [Rangifer tarandus platyrhynchus]
MLLWHSALISISATLIIQCNRINSGFSDFTERTNSNEHFSERACGTHCVLAFPQEKGKPELPMLKECGILVGQYGRARIQFYYP